MKFKSDIELQAGLRDGSNDIGTAGQILSSTGSQTNWIDQSSIVASEAKLVFIECKNTSGSAISKGTPVYQTGTVGATDVIEVDAADASDEDKMAAIGLLQTDLANNAFGKVVITGELLNITTSPIDGVTPVTGDTIYVKPGGGLTLTKPTGVNFIQNVGLVGKVSGGSAGSITVSSIMRSNDVPTPLYIDHTNQRLGIGVTPSQPLDVNGTALIRSTVYVGDNIQHWGDGGTGLYFGTDTLSLQNNGGNTRLYIQSGGNVGIGTTSPTHLLTLETASSPGLKIKDTTQGATLLAFSQDSNSHIGTYSSHPLVFDTNSTERMRIDQNGNVGIGTTNMYARLNVKATSHNNGISVNRAADNTAALYIGNDGGGTPIFAANNADMIFGKDFSGTFTETMRLTNGGNVGIGTTSPGAKLDVSGEARFTGDITVGNTAGSQINMLRTSANYINATNNTGYLVFRTGGYNTALTLDASQNATFAGSVTVGTNANIDNNLTVSGGNITLGGTGRIQGVDTVSASTDATNKAYVDNAIAGTLQMVKFNRSGINSSTYTMLATVNGNNLASILKMTMTGTSGNVVFACTFDITVNHSQDIHVKSSNGDYTEVTLRITSDNNEDFSIEAKHNGSSTTTAEVCIYPLADEIITPTTTDPGYTGAEYEHTATEGWRYGGEDNNVESSNVIVDGNVGIGTTTPSTKLEVAASATTSVDIAHFSNSNGVVKINHSLDGVGAGKISILDSSNNEDIRLSAQGDSWFNAGNLGIGTTSPGAKLNVIGGSGDDIIAKFKTTGTGTGDYSEIHILNDNNDALKIGSIGSNYTNSSWAGMRYVYADSGDLGLKAVAGTGNVRIYAGGAGSERMRITSAGNVGIGTTSPGTKLTISASNSGAVNNNTLRFVDTDVTTQTNQSFGKIEFETKDTNNPGVNAFINAFAEGTGGTGALSFGTGSGGSTERMRIASSGYVGIGTTNPIAKLDVSGAIRSSHAVYNDINGIRLINPGGGSGNSLGNSGTVGAIKISLPQSWTSTMMRMSIKVYNYSEEKSFTVHCGGYNHGSSSSWINEFAYIESSSSEDLNFTVRFGYDSNNKCCIYIGELNSTWYYPKVFVTDFQAGFNNTTGDKWDNGWSISMETSAFENISQTRTNCQVNNWKRNGSDLYYGSGTGNVGIGTTSPDTKLHVNVASTADYVINANSRLKVKGDGTLWWGAAADYGKLTWDTGKAVVRSEIGKALSLGANGSQDTIYINTSQNVGIGTTSPSAKLEVNGQTVINSTGLTEGFQWFNDTNEIFSLEDTSGAGELLLLSSNSVKVKLNANGNSYFNGGNVGIGTTSPSAKLDIRPDNNNAKVLRVGNYSVSTYSYNTQADATIDLTCGSYYQAEVIITANQTNGGDYNNIYIRGIWSNNHTTHHWDEIESIGFLTGSSIGITVGQNTVSNSGKLSIDFNYTSQSFSILNIKVTDFYGSHSYSIS